MELSKSTLKKWSNMTDNNYHTEVRYEIASYFNYLHLCNFYQHLIDKNRINSGLSCNDVKERYENDNLLMKQICDEYGNEVLFQVKNCL